MRWTAGTLSALVLGTAGAGYLYYRHLNGNLHKAALNLGDDKVAESKPNADGQVPLNVLLIGSDARDSKENQELGGAKQTFGAPPLGDVQMLLHLSADRSNMSVISIPRDTLVHIPKCTDPENDKVYPATISELAVNESLGRGGPGCTVATWEQLTGIHIDHFMQVDFSGVVSMADAIGGVPVCVDRNVLSKDSQGHGSGLKLPEGTHSIKGVQALQWLRTRYGFEDNSDLGRTKAQHMYMNSMVRELRENATLSNPNKVRNLAEKATSALTVDPGLGTVKKLYDLANDLKQVPPKRITMTTMPNVRAGERVRPAPVDSAQLFRLVREDIGLDGKDAHKPKPDKDDEKGRASDDPAASDAEIAVQVQNATRTTTQSAVPQRATLMASALMGKGFTRATADGSAQLGEARTMVRFPRKDLEGDAQRVAEALGIPLKQVELSPSVSGVTLVVGADWRESGAYPSSGGSNAAEPEDDHVPDSANALNGSDDKACMKVNPHYTW